MKKRFVLLMVIGVLTAIASVIPSAWGQSSPRRIEITAKRFSYTPNEITLKKGQPVVLVLKSVDVAHGLRVADLDVNLKSSAGGTAEVRFTPDKTGDFIGHCSVFCGSGHGSMVLKLHVVD